MDPDPFDDLVAGVGPLAGWFVEAGYRIYAVGGLVRDRLIDRVDGDDADIDLTTDATPEQTKQIVGSRVEAMWTQGERFGTIGVQYRGRIYEITTHRSEHYVPDSRKPAVAFASDIEADLARRDFTVNAMAVSIPDREFVDPFGGRRDLVARRLRTPLTAEESFADDPLRMLRAARFVATFDLVADPEVVAAAKAMASRIEIVSAERIMVELVRLLALENPLPGLALAAECGLLELVIPEADLAAPTDALLAATPPDHCVRLAVLLRGVNAAMASRRLRALRTSNEDRRRVTRLLQLVRVGRPDDDAGLRRLVRDAGDDLGSAVALLEALAPAAPPRLTDDLERLAAREDLSDLGPQIDGARVMELLGVGPGPAIGEALDHLVALRLDEGVVDPAEAERRLVAWWGSLNG